MDVKTNKNHFIIPVICFIVLNLIIGFITAFFIKHNGAYPTGTDVMYHVYRGDYLYNNWKQGILFPIFNPYWYNGVELFRYWPPLSPIIFAIAEFINKGNVFNTYISYLLICGFIGTINWFYIGYKCNRIYLGIFLGFIWAFLPNNIHHALGEGNLAAYLIMMFLPLFLFSIYDYMQEQSLKKALKITFSFFCILLCHLGYSILIFLAVLFFFLFYTLINNNLKLTGKTISFILLAFILDLGLIIPGTTGGMTSNSGSDISYLFFQSLFKTINPFDRIIHPEGAYYFNLSIFIIVLFGVICCAKKVRAGFITALFIVLLSSNTAYVFIKILPGHRLMWILRLTSVAVCFALLSFILWSEIKKKLLIVFCILMCLDFLPSAQKILYSQSNIQPDERYQDLMDTTLIRQAKEITKQRLCLLDESTLGSVGAFVISGYETPVKATFGAGWEAAVTSKNIVQLNEALTNLYYPYLFDRAKELGNDTVLISKSRLKNIESVSELKTAAADSCYQLIAENDDYILFHLDTYDTWGTVTKYEGIGIGNSAATISLAFPNVKETTDPLLDNYSYEELSQYKIIYLNQFTYKDKKLVEERLKRLSENGVKIVIMADGIPIDEDTRTMTFLDVTANHISFENGYPILSIAGIGANDCSLFPKGYNKWATVYLNGLDNNLGSFMDNDIKLYFYGTKYNDNIVFLGLNFSFFYYLTHDITAEKVLAQVMYMPAERLPIRTIVPLKIDYSDKNIKIQSAFDNVNTGISYHDIFSSDQNIYSDNHLLYVNKGKTQVNFKLKNIFLKSS